MPTSENASSAELLQKILPAMLESADSSGWTDEAYARILTEMAIPADIASRALPSGLSSLVAHYFEKSLETLECELASLDLDDMRIRDKVTSGVRIWLDYLSTHHTASVKALDWITAHPLGPLPPTELVWQVADNIWTGIGDTSTGFTFMSKRTILSGVIASTLAVWRKGDEKDWSAFLDRRIADVMAFEKFKAKFKLPLPA